MRQSGTTPTKGNYLIHHRAKPITLKPKKRLHIIPLGDIQSESQLKRLSKVVQWSVEETAEGNPVYFFLLGDYFECTSPSERWKLAGANLHETTYETLNRANIIQADQFIECMLPAKGRIWTVLKGHHSSDLMFGKEIKGSDVYIAESLTAEYAGDGVLTIYLTVNGLPFKIFCMHGYGSARTDGAQMTKRLRMREIVLDANVYAMGHDNSKQVLAKEPFLLTPEGMKPIKQYFVGIGSFQESYELGKMTAGYAEKLALAPSVLGVVRISIEVDSSEKMPRLDYHVRA